MIKRILILLLTALVVSSCNNSISSTSNSTDDEKIPYWTDYVSYVNEENDLGLYAKVSLPENDYSNFLFSIQRDVRYYENSCILVSGLSEVDSICPPILDPNLVEFRLVYRPTTPKQDVILLIIGEEFFTDNYLIEESDKDPNYPAIILGDVIYSIPFNRPSDQSLSFLEDLEFVVVIDEVEYLLFRGVTILRRTPF